MDSRSGAPQARPLSLDQAATEALRAGLAGTRFAQARWVRQTGSTNRDLLDELADPAAAAARRPAVLVTDHQTAGRGTKGRTWFDPPGGSLLLSVRLFPDVAPNRLHLFTMALSVAAAEACAAVAGVDVRLKWPNDLFVDDRKLAGVLAESSMRGAVADTLVIGIGLNVNWPEDVPAELRDVAVALSQLTGTAVDRVALALALLCGLERRLDALAGAGGDHALLHSVRARSATIGRQVRVELPAGPVVGEALDVDDDGHLVVRVEGQLRSFAAADVTHLRMT